MDRRGFLKALGVGAALLVTPPILHAAVFTQEYVDTVALEAAINASYFDIHPFLQDIPKMYIKGSTLAYARQNPYPLKGNRTYGHFSASLCSIIGDAETPPNLDSHGHKHYNTNAVLLSKAKSVGRKTMDLVVNGDLSNNSTEFDGLLKMAKQSGTDSNKMSWSMSTKKSGGCDKHYRNDWVPDGYEVQGNFDNGDHTGGVTLVYPEIGSHVNVRDLHNGDATIYRLTSYVSLALFNQADLKVIKL